MATVTCPCCGTEIEINPAALLAQGCSDKKRAALSENAKKPRPGSKGVPRPWAGRKKKVTETE